jgi:hypothetical protein
MKQYPKVRFNVKRIVALYKAGKNVSEIAQAIGYPTGHRNNRVPHGDRRYSGISESARRTRSPNPAPVSGLRDSVAGFSRPL